MRRAATAALAVMVAVMLSAVLAAAGETAADLTSANAQKQETTFGDLVTDALCDASRTAVALAPAVGFKSGTIPVGPVTADGVRPLLTKPTELWAVVKLTGVQLRQTLERSLSRAPLPNAGFLQVSGLTLTYDPEAPRDERIVSLKASGEDVQPEKQYEVAMPLSLAKGGSGYFQIFGEEQIVKTGSDEICAVIVRFVDKKETVSYTGQGRINVKGQG
jgi:5'-nucleotidase/UDP-sugar diphosphatase